MRTLRILAASVRDLGLAATLDRLPWLLAAPLVVRRLERRKREELSRDGFDAAHGTDTATILVGRALGPAVTRDGHLVIHYETTSEASIRLALDGVGVDVRRFTFVDLGCGKGKPLMIAATYPFRRLIGVDISPACVAAARRNIARHGPERIDSTRVELRVGDAAQFTFPLDPLVVYLYNPFPAAVLERVVANLEASLRERARPVAVVYMNPRALTALRRSEFLQRLPAIDDRLPGAVPGMPEHERAALFVTRPEVSGGGVFG